MYVCICNSVTDEAIRQAVRQGTVSFEQLRFELGVSRSCGRCEQHARSVMAHAITQELPAVPNGVILPGPVLA